MIWLTNLIEKVWAAVAKKQEPEVDPLAANRTRAVERARRIAAKSSTYILGAGGRDPKAETPFTKKDEVYGSDCVGFTCWCLGHDRYQPATFPTYDGWLNTDSILIDARGYAQEPWDMLKRGELFAAAKRSWYAPVRRPEPGDVVVFPSIVKDGKRERIGHIGLVVDVPPEMPADVYALPPAERRAWLLRVKVIDCAGAASRKPYAVKETTAAASWDKPDAMFARLVRAP